MKALDWHAAPAKTWLCCRQCRSFYTREHPCACRSEEDERVKGKREGHMFASFWAKLSGCLRGWRDAS
jgi:hypothetical protein